MDHVLIYTDGACQGNPGPGGWAALLIYKNANKALSGFEKMTTNNRMELMAVIKGLEALKKECTVTVRTDSQYVKNGITVWVKNWQEKGWKTASKQEVKNQDLWIRLIESAKHHSIKWEWVKGHADDALNNEVDMLAREAIVNGKDSLLS